MWGILKKQGIDLEVSYTISYGGQQHKIAQQHQ